jgi:hypothetical protein
MMACYFSQLAGAGFAAIVWSGLAFCQVAPLQPNQFMASPSNGTGYLAPRTMAPSDIAPAGLIGDGVINNNAALQDAFTAAASGGTISIPCGVYKITGQMTVTVASGKHFTLAGGGQNCAKIAVSGTVGGMTITQADETAGVSLRDFTITTDQAGTQSAIIIVKTTANVLNAYAVPISLQNVSVYGSDYPNADNPTKYWAHGFTLNNVNNVSLDNVFGIGGGCVSTYATATG